MADDYLWDQSGEPDREVNELEEVLRPLRHARPLAVFPESRGAPPARRRPRGLLAAAAAVVLALAGGGAFFARGRGPAWDVRALAGTPRIGNSPFTNAAHLRAGSWLETDAGARARIEVGRIGSVDLEPGSRLRLVDASESRHRLRLERGRLRALVWAPPRHFAIETPGALAVDLGCAYTLAVDERGSSLLRVETGWVAFEWRDRDAFVPAGASCRSAPGQGPGTPFFEDASERFREALARIDAAAEARAEVIDRTLVGAVLAEARPRDALTLWHLLQRLDGDARARTFERLAALVALPTRVTREGVLAGDRRMLYALWQVLGYGDSTFWRRWQGEWMGPSN